MDNLGLTDKEKYDLIMKEMNDDLLSYAMGIYPKFINSRFAETLCWEIQQALDGVVGHDRLIIQAPPRHGKRISSLFPMTYKDLDGHIKLGVHGDLKAGFKVLHWSGEWYNIKETFSPDRIDKNVTFSTNETVSVHNDHLWQVLDIKETRRNKKLWRNKKANYKATLKRQGKDNIDQKVNQWVINNPQPTSDSCEVWKVMTTEEIKNCGLAVELKRVLGKRGSRYRFQVRRCLETKMNEDWKAPMDPYWFGYWLGDGSKDVPRFYVGEKDFDVFNKHHEKFETNRWYDKNSNVYQVKTNLNVPYGKPKEINNEWKTCSVQDRKKLLAGLIDSDGHVDRKSGRVRIVNTNLSIIEGVEFIARSLGYTAHRTSVDPHLSTSGIQGRKVVHTVSFWPTSELPTIYERKKITKLAEPTNHSITSIEDIPEDEQPEGFCISVDSPDNTYIVGETFINTHNTLITSEIAPAWFMGKYPDRKIIAASHTAELAVDNGMKVRTNISDPLHEQVFGRDGSLNRSKAAQGNFRTNGKGEYFAVGVGGTPIGKGADVYIIDDPIRNRADVESPKQREDLKSWYSSSVLTRLEGQGTIILMHQRWHEDDLAGYLIREHAEDGWRVVTYPAVIEDEEDIENDYLNRDLNESLIPGLHSYDKLMRLKENMQPRDWYSMYQQKPKGSNGDEFTEEMLQRYDTDPWSVSQNSNVYIIVDPANSKDKNSDYTAMVVIGVGFDGNYYILDMIRDRLDLSERADALIDLHRTWRPLAVGYESYGAQADIQHIEYIQNQQNYRFAITKLNSTKLKKEERIRRLVPDMNQGRWYAPHNLEKYNVLQEQYDPLKAMIEEEMVTFPVGKHDDAIDAVARIYDMPVIWPSSSGRTRNVTAKSNIISPW